MPLFGSGYRAPVRQLHRGIIRNATAGGAHPGGTVYREQSGRYGIYPNGLPPATDIRQGAFTSRG
nr:MAG TPA: hypothetical protein [Caudoviricetes sp.]